MKTTGKYDDMLELPRHVSSHRAPMSRQDRAAQFAPFAALTGFDGVIAETGRLTDSCAELTETEIEILDTQLRRISERLEERPRAEITWFCPDRRKKGGAYISTEGHVVKIDLYKREVCLTDDTRIPIDRIYHIQLLPQNESGPQNDP